MCKKPCVLSLTCFWKNRSRGAKVLRSLPPDRDTEKITAERLSYVLWLRITFRTRIIERLTALGFRMASGPRHCEAEASSAPRQKLEPRRPGPRPTPCPPGF